MTPAKPAHAALTAPKIRPAPAPDESPHAVVDDAALLGVVVQLVRQSTQVDLTHYKDSTFRRQLARRMAELGCATLGEYVARLNNDPDELRSLQRSLLISVTRFFRDPEVFERLDRAVRELIAAKPDGELLRLWVPGCATGEEAYSLAMLVMDALGERLGQVPVRLFATDIDDAAIAVARQGLYPPESVAGLPADLVARHFVADEGGVRLSRAVRDLCVFAHHDLLSQPPFVNLDMLSCRNVMIYFQPGVQAELLAKFHDALRLHGCLLLGQSESVGAHDELFQVEDKAARLYRKRPGLRPSAQSLPRSWRHLSLPVPHVDAKAQAADNLEWRFHQLLLHRDALPSALVSPEGQVLQTWGEVHRFLRLGSGGDFSLITLCPPELRADVRSLLQLALANPQEEACSTTLTLALEGQPCSLRMRAQALCTERGEVLGVMMSFDERTSRAPSVSLPPEDLSGEAIQNLRDELAVAREQLHAMSLQLERNHDERQALHEELQASSEELQSSNEELQASNEELSTLNEQLTAKSDELLASNDLLINIENSVQLAMVVVDTQMRVQRFNPLAVRIFGLMDHDMGRPLVTVPTSLPLDDLPKQLRQVLQDGLPHVSRVDQGDRHYVMQLSPLRDARGQQSGVIIGFTDVAELRQAEAERSRLAAIVTHSEDAIIGKTLDGVIVSWNPGAEHLFGHSAAEAIGQPMLLVFPDELKAEEADLLARVARGDTVRAFDTVRVHKDGHRVHVSVALSPIRDGGGRIIGVSKIARDITERVADEAVRSANLQHLEQLVQERTRELADKEQHLQAILEGIPGLVAYWGADLRLKYANRQHRNHVARSGANGGLGQHIEALLEPEHMARARPHVEQVMRGEQTGFDVGPVPAPGRSEPGYFQIQYVPHVRDNVVVGFIVMGFDITTVKRAEGAAAAASRAKSEFLANMSHEIRTPLNAVLGLAQVAQRHHAGQPVVDTFTQILQSGQHLLGIINDVLDFSKIEAGKLALQIGRVDVNELIDKAVGMVAGQARAKGLALRVSRDPQLAEAYAGDATRVAQLLINLLTNAVKFTEAGSVELVLRAQPGGVIILVSDTGPGMSEALMGRLFKPFEQGDGSTTRKVGGTGLGLSISKHLVDMMQGSIEAHSAPGQGAVFEVWLPLMPMLTHTPSPAGSEAPRVAAGGLGLQGLHILVAEDHPINQMVLQQLLQSEGASSHLVSQGDQAVAALKAALQPGPRPFDVVLCDIEMPVMDGYEATRLMRELAPELPILGLTAHAFDDARRRGEGVGMSGYLTKPYMLDELVTAIRRLVPRTARPADPADAVDDAVGPVSRAQPMPPIPEGLRLDPTALSRHYRTVPEFIPRLLSVVRDTCNSQPVLFEEALASGQADHLRLLAHGVMGVAANLLLPGLHGLAQELQEAATEDWSRAGELVAQVNAALELVNRQIDLVDPG
jgi:two-component system CheB/CheR fusion protein